VGRHPVTAGSPVAEWGFGAREPRSPLANRAGEPCDDGPGAHLVAVECPAVPPNSRIVPELFRERIAGTFPGNLGIEVISIEDERVEGRLVVDERHLHPGGYVHGGVWVAFADTVAAWGTLRNLPPGHDFTTIELKTNVFAPATTGDVLTAVGVPLHRGRRTQVWEVRCEANGRNGAFFTCTQMVLAP
jgi:1,4-dihydroxy-2-naphthoyl-CoA hydrolase